MCAAADVVVVVVVVPGGGGGGRGDFLVVAPRALLGIVDVVLAAAAAAVRASFQEEPSVNSHNASASSSAGVQTVAEAEQGVADGKRHAHYHSQRVQHLPEPADVAVVALAAAAAVAAALQQLHAGLAQALGQGVPQMHDAHVLARAQRACLARD